MNDKEAKKPANGPGRPRGTSRRKSDRSQGANRRTAIYASEELLNALESQAEQEETSNSGLISEILNLLLLSEAGQKLRYLANLQNHRLSQELADLLSLLLLIPSGEQEQSQQVWGEATSPAQLIADLTNALLSEPLLGQLQEKAAQNRRTLGQEVERNLILFREQIPLTEITDLAKATQRTPDEMLIRLMLVGLEVYKQREQASQE